MTPDRPTRGPYAKTAARRADILQAARDCFADVGYENASLRQVAERAGMTHAGLLHHFSNKDALLQGLLAQRDEDEFRRGLGLGDDRELEAPEDPGSFLIEVLMLEHQESPEIMRLWGELTAAASRVDHPAHNYFVDRYATARRYFVGWLAAEQERGALNSSVDPDSAALLFIAVLDGLQAHWLLDRSIDIIEPLRRFRDLILVEP